MAAGFEPVKSGSCWFESNTCSKLYIMSSVKEIMQAFEAKLEAEFIKYAVQKTIFCPKLGSILDYRTCILIEVKAGDKLIGTQVVSPEVVTGLDELKERLLKQLPHIDVVFKTLNKKLVNNNLILIAS